MSVITFLSPIKDQFKSKPFVKDSTLFWFFYRLTVALHCLFALMVGGRAYFGDPIDCAMRKSQAIGGGIIDNYCWVTGTWTVKDKPDDQILAKHMSSRRKVSEEKNHDIYLILLNIFYTTIDIINTYPMNIILGLEHSSKCWSL